jgi:hypothetical protein
MRSIIASLAFVTGIIITAKIGIVSLLTYLAIVGAICLWGCLKPVDCKLFHSEKGTIK